MKGPGGKEAIKKKCAEPCGFIYTGDEEADKAANKAKWLVDNKDVPVDDLATKGIETAKTTAMCTMKCAFCKSDSGASNLALGAAALTTAFALLM